MDSKPLRFLSVIFICAVTCGCAGEGPNSDGSKLREVERLWQIMPVFPGMVEVDSSTSSSGSEAVISRKFKSDASFEDVKRFYIERLAKNNWQFTGEREVKDRGRNRGERLLEFRQGEYNLSIKYAGERVAEVGWTYSIAVSWPD